MKVLVCGVGSNAGNSYIRRLFDLKNGYDLEIIGSDVNPPNLVSASSLCDRFVNLGYHTDSGFDTSFREFICEHKIDAVFPLQNGELRAVSKLPNTKSPRFEIPSDLYDDKFKMAKFLEQQGVCVPEVKSDNANLGDINNWLKKKKNGGGSVGVGRLTNKYELTEGDYFERRISGTEYTVDSFVDRNSGYEYSIARERLETKAGVCTKCRLHFDDRFKELSSLLGRILGQHGALCYQVIDDGLNLHLFDLNLRAGGGTEMSRFSGLDFFDANLCLALGIAYKQTLKPKNIGKFVTRQYVETLS